MTRKDGLDSKPWAGKLVAGLIFGFGISLAMSGVMAELFLAPAAGNSITIQMTMWLVPPVWMVVLATSVLFRRGLAAWLWLGAANTLAVGLLFAVRGLS